MGATPSQSERFHEADPETLKVLHGPHSARYEEPSPVSCCVVEQPTSFEVAGSEECKLSTFFQTDYDEGYVFDHHHFGYEFGYHTFLQTQCMVHKASGIVVVENAIDMREDRVASSECMVLFHYTSQEFGRAIVSSACKNNPALVEAFRATARGAGMGDRILALARSPQQLGSKLVLLEAMFWPSTGDPSKGPEHQANLLMKSGGQGSMPSDPQNGPVSEALGNDPELKHFADCCFPVLIGRHRVLDFSGEFLKEVIPITESAGGFSPQLGLTSPRSLASPRSLSSPRSMLTPRPPQRESGDRIFQNMKARLEKMQSTIGANDIESMLAEGVLAASLRDAGRHAEAAMLYQGLLTRTSEIYGMEHEYTLIAMGNLAATTRKMGNLVAAESLGRQRLVISADSLGIRHEGTLAAIRGLLLTLCELNKWAEAQQLKAVEEQIIAGEDVKLPIVIRPEDQVLHLQLDVRK